MTSGWFRDSYRHYLAAKGVKSGRVYAAPISLRPKFTQGMRDNWRSYTEGVREGKYLGIPGLTSEATRERESNRREKVQEDLRRQQEMQRSFEGQVMAKPLSADELRKKRLLEDEMKLSLGLRVELARKREVQVMNDQISSLLGIDDYKYSQLKEIIKDPAKVTPVVDSWVANARSVVHGVEVRDQTMAKMRAAAAKEAWQEEFDRENQKLRVEGKSEEYIAANSAARVRDRESNLKIKYAELTGPDKEERVLMSRIDKLNDIINTYDRIRESVERYRQFKVRSPIVTTTGVTEFNRSTGDLLSQSTKYDVEPWVKNEFERVQPPRAEPIMPSLQSMGIKITKGPAAAFPKKGWGGLNA